MRRSHLGHVWTAISIVVIATLAQTPSAFAAGPDDRIVFSRILDGGGAAIVTAEPDGSNEVELSLPDLGEDFAVASWSPDHARLLISNMLRFDANGDLLPFRPAIVAPDGSDYRLLAIPDGPGDMYCSAWSAHGERIFCAFGGDVPGIFSVRASDGGDARRITTNPFGATDLPTDVSPDGSQIVFVRQRRGPSPDPQPFRTEQFALDVVNVDGSHLRQIVPFGVTQGHEIGSAHWSPDGRAIISTNTHGRLFTVRPDGRALTFLKLDIDGFAFMPNWSRDGNRIVFGLGGPAQEDLYTANLRGANVTRVTNTGAFENGPDWR